jgi:hypothetical protein
MSGTYSPYLSNIIVSPDFIPLSTSTENVFYSATNLYPRQVGHYLANTFPLPLQTLQGYCICIYIIPMFMF